MADVVNIGEARARRTEKVLRQLGVDTTPLACGCPGMHFDICPDRGDCTGCGGSNEECLVRNARDDRTCCDHCKHPVTPSEHHEEETR